MDRTPLSTASLARVRSRGNNRQTFALLGTLRVAPKIEKTKQLPYIIPAGCLVFRDTHGEEIRCQALNTQISWFDKDVLVLLTDWRYIPQSSQMRGETAPAWAYLEVHSSPVLLSVKFAIPRVERTLSWWQKHQVFPELELEERFTETFKSKPAPINNYSVAASLLVFTENDINSDHTSAIAATRRCTGAFTKDIAILGRVNSLSSLIPTKDTAANASESDKVDLGFLVEVALENANSEAIGVSAFLRGQEFLPLYASLSIGDSLYICDLYVSALTINKGSNEDSVDHIAVFMTSSDSQAYRINDFDGMDSDTMQLAMLASQVSSSQQQQQQHQPFTQSSQDSLLSQITSFENTVCSSQYAAISQQQLRQQQQPAGTEVRGDSHLLVHKGGLESYSGTITAVLDMALGVYVVDDSHLLALTFWPNFSSLTSLRCGTQVLLENMHIVLLSNSQSYHWGWLRRLWPEKQKNVSSMDEQRALVFAACSRSSIRIKEFSESATPCPPVSIVPNNLSTYIARGVGDGGLVRMIEVFEAFWKLKIKFPQGTSSGGLDGEQGKVLANMAREWIGYNKENIIGQQRSIYSEFLSHQRCCHIDYLPAMAIPRVISIGDIIRRFRQWQQTVFSAESFEGIKVTRVFPLELELDATVPLVGYLAAGPNGDMYIKDTTGVIKAHTTLACASDNRLVTLPGQLLLGHTYVWSHWKFVIESVNTGMVNRPTFDLFYVAPSRPKILLVDHKFGISATNNKGKYALRFIFFVHSQTTGASLNQESNSKTLASSKKQVDLSLWHSRATVRGAALPLNEEEASKSPVSLGIRNAKQLHSAIVAYETKKTGFMLRSGCAYVVGIRDSSSVIYADQKGDCIGKLMMAKLERNDYVSPANISLDCPTAPSDTTYSVKNCFTKLLVEDAIFKNPQLSIPEIYVASTEDIIAHRLKPPVPVFSVKELLEKAKVGFEKMAHRTVSVYGTIIQRNSKKVTAVAFPVPDQSPSKRQKTAAGSTSSGAGLFEYKVFLTDTNAPECRMIVFIKFTSFAHPLGLLPNTNVVFREMSVGISTNSKRIYLQGTVASSVECNMAESTSESLREAEENRRPELSFLSPQTSTVEKVCVGQLYKPRGHDIGKKGSRFVLGCRVDAVEHLRVSVRCLNCNETLCGMSCPCRGRGHVLVDETSLTDPNRVKTSTIHADIKLQCLVTDGSGLTWVEITRVCDLVSALGLSESALKTIYQVAAQKPDREPLVWKSQPISQESVTSEHPVLDEIIEKATNASKCRPELLWIEGMLYSTGHLEKEQSLYMDQQSSSFTRQTLPRVLVHQMWRLSATEICDKMLQ